MIVNNGISVNKKCENGKLLLHLVRENNHDVIILILGMALNLLFNSLLFFIDRKLYKFV
jgi:hypothetical protein